MINKLVVSVCLASLMLIPQVKAMPITVAFEASGFPLGAAQDPVAGSFVYDAASATSPINSLTSINLTISGHVYTFADVGFISPYVTSSTFQLIGGTADGVGVLLGFADDFWIYWDLNTLAPGGFAYSTPGQGGYLTNNFTQFSVAASSVPEPGSLILLAGGLGGLILHRRRRAHRLARRQET